MNQRNNRDLHLAWERITEIIRPKVGEDTFQRWFEVFQILALDKTQITLRVPNNIHQIWIETNYMGLLQTSILEALGSPRKIRFTITDISPEMEMDTDESPAAANGMNPRNTFDSFLVGTNNQYARAAALAVAQNPAKTYNPLFVYGGVGLGKTHLMHAIGQHVATTKKQAKVMYLSGEKFTIEFIDAIQNSKLARFRTKYRQADVLLIDDIQVLVGKEHSQGEFIHTFNTFFDGHKQIILSSSCPPGEIQNLDARLASRFEWGLTVELHRPDYEMRMAILHKKMEALGGELDSRVLGFLAQRIRSNVRRLEGAFMRVAAFASMSGRELTLDTVEHLLKDILQKESHGAFDE